MTDFHSVLNRLLPKQDGEQPVKYRKGIVAGVGSGVIDVLLSGVVVPDVAIHGTASVSDEVHLLVWPGDLLAIGECGGGGGCSGCDLGDLADVNLAGLQDGDTIVWDATAMEWIPGSPPGASINVEDNDTFVAAATTLNFGSNLSVTDDGGGQVTIDASGGGGGGGVVQGRFQAGATTSYMLPGIYPTDVTTSAGWTADTTWYFPLVLQSALTVANLVAECTGGNAGGRLARIGLYEADGNFQPGDLVVEGQIDLSTTGLKTVALAGVVPAGRYVTALLTNHATPAFRIALANPFGSILLGSNLFITALSVTGSFAALPDPGTAYTDFLASSTPFNYAVFLDAVPA